LKNGFRKQDNSDGHCLTDFLTIYKPHPRHNKLSRISAGKHNPAAGTKRCPHLKLPSEVFDTKKIGSFREFFNFVVNDCNPSGLQGIFQKVILLCIFAAIAASANA
jgi:hypothetical protein